jgi:hypothetical protein
MTPTINYLTAQAHLHDHSHDARRHCGYEVRVRQVITRPPPRQVTRRTRQVPVASYH